MFRRIESFSLIEMLVVLILSSIIVSVIYFTYYIISTYQVELSKKQRASEDLATLYFLLKEDSEGAEKMIGTESRRIEMFSEKRSVSYSFDSTFVLRQQLERIDTFYGRFGDPEVYWIRKPIIEYPSLIDELQVPVYNLAEAAQIKVIKSYDAASLVNHSTQKDTLP